MFKDLLAVLFGSGIVLVYFFLYNIMVKATRRLSPTSAQAIILFGYFGRLAVVGTLLILAVLAGLDALLTSVSFLVVYTLMFLLSQRRAAGALAAAGSSGRKG